MDRFGIIQEEFEGIRLTEQKRQEAKMKAEMDLQRKKGRG